MEWEYITAVVTNDGPDGAWQCEDEVGTVIVGLDDILNSYGSANWELVTILNSYQIVDTITSTHQTPYVTLVFKRPLGAT